MSGPGAGLAPAGRPAARGRPRAWWLVVAARAIVFAVAAAGAAFALLATDHAPRGSTARYRCPMHPDAVAPAPAACPICGMALVLATRPVAPAAVVPPRVARATRRTFAEQVRAPAWVAPDGAVVAQLYRDDLVGLAPGQRAEFFAAVTPGLGVGVALGVAPAVDWDGATVHVRFVGDGARPGDHGWLVLPAQPRARVVVPSSAVVVAATGPAVFVVDPASHREVRRAVQLGRAHRGVTAVVRGVADGDEVVVGDAFFVAAEQDLHPDEAR